MASGEGCSFPRLPAGLNSKVATVTPTKKLPPPPPAPPPPPPPAATPNGRVAASTCLSVANTRKMGRKVHMKLVKGPQGLGFSVTTRDNPAGGNCPIYIKNILPKGAAIDDGRLRPGDRLLEVCTRLCVRCPRLLSTFNVCILCPCSMFAFVGFVQCFYSISLCV